MALIVLIGFVLVTILVIACINWRASRHHKRSMKALEKAQREAIRGDREIEQAQRDYDKAKADLRVAVERFKFRVEMRDKVFPQANRRLRHLMMD